MKHCIYVFVSNSLRVCFCQELAKSHVWQRYHKNKRVTFFLRHSVVILFTVVYAYTYSEIFAAKMRMKIFQVSFI